MLDAEPKIASRLPHLKYWVSSGEAIDPNLIRDFRELAPDRILLNLYGSSEASADVTYFDTREMSLEDPVLVGRPIANTQIYIVDRDLQPLPVGVPGQLGVSGNGLARGYLNQPDRTAEKFVPHSLSDGMSSRLYLTGDLARYRPDGNIELLGRIDHDHQVKIRGFRIEPAEIEAALRQHSSVAQAAVTTTTSVTGEARLVAYIVPSSSAFEGELVQQLRQHLRERLPEYMVPAAFVVVPALPLLPNGKLDRHALPQMSQSDAGHSEAQPSTPTEFHIHQVWRDVLQIEHVGIHDNFFDVGGHSLLLAAVQTKLAEAFDRDIASVDLYRYPTISALAKRLNGDDPSQRPLEHVAERARKQKETRSRRKAFMATRPR
jgi:acyl-coenzyme A synthetase/AMP-(fatty) acid ligase